MPKQRRYYYHSTTIFNKTILILVLLLMAAIATAAKSTDDAAEWNYTNNEEGGEGGLVLPTPPSLPERLRRAAAAASEMKIPAAAADSTRRRSSIPYGHGGGGGHNVPASPYPLLLDDVDVSISLMGSYNSLPDLLDDQNRPLPPQQHPMGSSRSSVDQNQRSSAADEDDDNVDLNHDDGGGGGSSSRYNQETSAAEAAFIGALETNVTVGLGQTAFLRCRLKNTQHQVTWIRMRDWHILTSGLLTYTADARFRVKHQSQPLIQPPPTMSSSSSSSSAAAAAAAAASIVPSRPDVSEWTLEIKFLQARDEGTYYCQIPTRTGTMVHAFHLYVASPQAVILGGQVSHVDILTPSLTLVCIVDNTPDPPQVIFWYHNGTLLKDGKYPETGASGVLSSHLTLTSTRTMSMLTLQNIQHVHSGNYTCRAPNAEPDTTQLFVTQRHEQAAVHRSNWSNSAARRNRLETTSAMLTIAAAVAILVVTVRRK